MTTTKATALMVTIRDAMQAQGVNMSEMARRTGTSKQTMRMYVHGEKHPGAPVVQRMLDALGLDPARMIETRASG